ncbi:MAG: hypothetical protein QM610_11390 [Chitinophagaceae bacterium]
MINLNNYEAWFLLYTDNELDAAQKTMVERFVAVHPQLREAFEGLKNTVLKAPPQYANNWNGLLKPELSMDWQEKALLALDGELDAPRQKEWNDILQENKDAQAFHDSLLKTKLPTELMECPNKETLLRKEKKPIIIPIWLRYVSVAAVLTGIVWFAWNILKTEKTPPTMAVTQPGRNAISDSSRPSMSRQDIHPDIAESPKANIVKASFASNKTEKPKEKIKSNNHIPIVHAAQVEDRLVHTEKIEVKTMAPPTITNAIVQDAALVNINAVNVETTKPAAARSGKRMVVLNDTDNAGKVYVANTEIKTQKLFGWLKKNKFGKSKTNTKKIEIANFEITVKTNEL